MRAMTPEERFERIERQLEFLAANQAQLSSSVETLRDVAVRHDGQIIQLADVVSSLVRIVEKQGQRMEEQGRRTDERLNTLINVVERYFSNGNN